MSLSEVFVDVTERLDSWLNVAMGFGGVSDKIKATRFSGLVRRLPDPELTAMYRAEHLSAKIVDVYPKEAYREGFELTGFDTDGAVVGDDDTEEQISNVLRAWQVVRLARTAAIWGRLYGGAKVWLGSHTADPATPFVMGEQIDFLRVIDRRYLTPRPWMLDALGNPTYYDVTPPEGGGTAGPIHASRLVSFGGSLTDDQTRVTQGFWDDSVLQRAYEALQSDGLVWRSAQQVISEASIGVLRIKGLYQRLTGPARQVIENRLAFFNASRSVARNMTLDFDGEDYKRENTTFAGLSDITREGLLRVASAAEVPIAILLSDEPGGLNATGDSSIRWWLMRVHAYRTGELDTPTLYLCKAVLAQAEISGVRVEAIDRLTIKWPELWTPNATEAADIRFKNAQADDIDIQLGIITADEAAKSHYGKDGYSQEITIDRSMRIEPDEAELARAAAEGEGGGTGPTGETAPVAKPGAGPVGENVQQQVLNGTQVSSLVDIVAQVSGETIPRDAGVQIIMLAYQVDQPKAEALMGSAGKGFKAKEPEPAAPFGKSGAPPPPDEAELARAAAEGEGGGTPAKDPKEAPPGQDPAAPPKDE